MKGEFLEQSAVQTVSEVQRQAISGTADLRRGKQRLGSELDILTKRDVPQSLAATYTAQAQRVLQIMNGSAFEEPPLAREEAIASSLQKADHMQDIAPNLSALHFAKAASLQQEAALPYSDTLIQAKKYTDLSQKQGINRSTPADYLPDAYILRIANRAAAGVVLPSPMIVAQSMQEDQSLLADYALVLPEEQRGAFLEGFPEDKRHEISVQLDKAVSGVLSGKVITEQEEIDQRDALKDRVRATFAHSLEALKPMPDDEERNFGGRALGSRWSSRQLTETLINLDERDSLQLLRDLAMQTTRELKAANKQKHLKRLSTDEKQEALQPFLSFTGRVLNTLIEADSKRGGTLTMRYLEMSALPDHLFSFFTQKLSSSEYFTKNLSPFAAQRENVPVLKKLMAQYGPQFNTIIDTLSQTTGYATDHQLVPRKEELFTALTDLGTVTPRIFKHYREKEPSERKAFAEKIRELKPKFFQNVPIKDILDPQDRDILAEMVYMAYKPQGMSFGKVDQLIQQLDERTDDLSAFTFPQEGYPVSLEKSGGYVIKEGQKVDLALLRRYNKLFSPISQAEEAPTPETDKQPTPFADALRSYLIPPSETEASEQPKKDPDEILRTLLDPLRRKPRQEAVANNAYNAASELAEIAGHDFTEYYTDALAEYLSYPDEDELEEVITILQDPAVQTNIDARLTNRNDAPVDWHQFNEGHNEQTTAEIITRLIKREQMVPIGIQLESELSKYTIARPNNAPGSQNNLKAYVSKNVGSFFAKAAAGLCTSDDIPLFEREDHFHINVVENDETVRANNQAYVVSVEGKPSLILRGFNPTAEWVGKIDVESYCEEILRIGKQFQEANGLDAVYITEQGTWHALSNREQPARYLTQKYTDGKPAIPFSLQVSGGNGSGGHTVQRIYKV